MKKRQAADSAGATSGKLQPRPSATPVPAPMHDSHVSAGNVLWTLTHKESTAQARRWITPTGFELELQIWTGSRVEGEEDLCWSQLFTDDAALAAAAVAKKRQLQAGGWLEDVVITPR